MLKRFDTYVEDFKAGDVEHANEHGTSQASLKCQVTLLDNPLESTVEQSLWHSTDAVVDLIDIPSLSDELSADLDLGFTQVPIELLAVYTKKLSNNFTGLQTKQYMCFSKKNIYIYLINS